MKELYIAPEVKRISFAATEKLAATEETLSYDDFLGQMSGGPTKVSTTDIKIPIKLT